MSGIEAPSGVHSGSGQRRSVAAAAVLALAAGLGVGLFIGGDSHEEDDGLEVEAVAPDPVEGSDLPALGSGDPAVAMPPAGPSLSPMAGGPIDRIFVREVDEIRVRAFIDTAHLGSTTSGMGTHPDWSPPAACSPRGSLIAQVSNPGAVGVVHVPIFEPEALRDEDHPVNGTVVVSGAAEGDPMWVATLQVDPAVTEVHVTFADGSADAMEPVDGLAVLVAPASETPPPGEVVPGASVDLAGPEPLEGHPIEPHGFLAPDPASCMAPPPELPEPGEVQPDDVDAARAEVIAAVDAAFSGDEERQHEGVEDFEAVRPAFESVRDGMFAEQVDNARARVDGVVFESDTRAIVKYDIVIPDYIDFGDRLLAVELGDEGWRVATDGICDALALAMPTEPCPMP